MPTKKPKVSVILPCYNVADCMDKMFESLRNQTFSDIEIICVDDKSTDDTKKRIKSFMKQDKRIVLYPLNKNHGVGHARNYGFKKACGEFVCFLDPDDYIDENFIEKLYDIAKQNKAEVVKGGFKTDGITNNLNFDIQNNAFHFNQGHTSALYNRKFLSDNNILYPEDVITGQDTVFLSNLVLHVKKIFVTNDVGYNYVRRPGSLDSNVLSHNKFLSRIKMLDYKIAMFKAHVFDTDENKNLFIQKQILAHFFYTLASLSDQDKENAFKWLMNNKDILGMNNIALFCKPYQIRAIKQNNLKKLHKTKLFYKERCNDNTRNIYVFGIKIFSYKKSNKQKIKHLNYKTYNDLAKDIKSNIHKIPDNIDLIVGIPRSGMIPAYMLGLALNKRVCSLPEFMSGQFGGHGITRSVDDSGQIKNVLILDDSIDSGQSMIDTKNKLSGFAKKYNFYFSAVYCSDSNIAKIVDVPLIILPQPRVFQWNYLNHRIAEFSCFDIDGVLGVDPLPEENDDGEKYKKFLLNARPLYIPKRTIAAIVTSRLEKYRPETEKWLKDHGVKYEKLYMLRNMTAEERCRKGVHAEFKAKIYKKLSDTSIFIESDPRQAKKIAQLTGKMVFCATTDELF